MGKKFHWGKLGVRYVLIRVKIKPELVSHLDSVALQFLWVAPVRTESIPVDS